MSDIRPPDETFILFELAGTIYGVRSCVVRQIEMIERITPTPNTPAFVEGVIFSRGQVLPVINLRQLFGFEKIPHNLRTRLIVVHTAGRTVGLLVDTAREFGTIPANAIQPPPETLNGLRGMYLEGIAIAGERLVLILHVDQVLRTADVEAPSRATE